MDVQDQVYIVAGFLGFVSFLFLILICFLFSKIQNLRRQDYNGGYSSGGGAGSGDLLEKRGFSEYKGPAVVSSPSPMTPVTHGGMSRQMSNAGYSSYQSPPPAPVVKAHTSTSAYERSQSQVTTYGKSGYDNEAYEERERTLPRDLTAGGVRVLPSTATIDHQIRRTNNYENSDYY